MTNNPRMVLLAMALAFLLPVVIAVVLFSMDEIWRPSGTVNHGELVSPVRPVKEVALQQLDGTPINAETLRGKWTYAYIDRSDCDEICQHNLYKIRQVRLAQAGEALRVQRLFVVLDDARPDSLQALLAEHPGLIAASAAENALQAFMRPFDIKPGSPVDQAQRVYLIDPLGNLMMSYDPSTEPKGMIKDLERLLKFSKIG